MPAPVVVAAGKFVAQQGLKQVNKRFPGGIVGAAFVTFMAGLVALGILVTTLFNAVTTSVMAAQDQCGEQSGPQTASPVALAGIPEVALQAYQKAGKATGVDWIYIAAIGKNESGHGSANGATLGTNGVAAPSIMTPPLNGSGFGGNTTPMRYTGQGATDGWDHGIGPMQFLLSTWYGGAGKDGNADGKIDPNNIWDAALASGFYLKSHGAPANMDAAIFAYNRSSAYVAKIKATAMEYKTAAERGGPAADNGTDGVVPAAMESVAPGQFQQPVAADKYSIGATFGSDQSGQQYLTVPGVPVNAVADGTVKAVSATDVTLDLGKVEGKAITVTYRGVAKITVGKGTSVTAGSAIAATKGIGFVLELRANGTLTDPNTYFAAVGGTAPGGEGSCGGAPVTYSGNANGVITGPWGGHSNGRIPASALCPIPYQPVDSLRCDAQKSFMAMNALYKSRFQSNICFTDGYRSYDKQVYLYATKPPGVAAKPGTSNHGWGMATDLGCGINQFGTPQYQWMKANAPKFGWHHPAWAEPGGRSPEPWHWQYGQSP